MLALSVVPPSRFFPRPRVAFDTEVAVLSAGHVVTRDESSEHVLYVAAEDQPDAPRHVVVREGNAERAKNVARRVIDRLAWNDPALPHQRCVTVESLRDAELLAPALADAGFYRSQMVFWAISADELARGEKLDLEPAVGDDAWRLWTSVEREIVAEASSPAPVHEALLARSVEFKRRQQRDTPPIRRFVALERGEPIAMIGYAPFADCDLASGVLVRLRDVAVRPSSRRRGVGTALLRAIAARAIDECGAAMVLIGSERDGAGSALYRRVGAHSIGRWALFTRSSG